MRAPAPRPLRQVFPGFHEWDELLPRWETKVSARDENRERGAGGAALYFDEPPHRVNISLDSESPSPRSRRRPWW